METIQLVTLVAVIIALGLSLYALYKCNKSSSEKYGRNVKWNPPVVDPSKVMQWSSDPAQNAQMVANCKNAFAQIDSNCQATPMKAGNPDYNEDCADYPMYFCAGNMMSTGNMDDQCLAGNPVAFSPDQCTAPVQSQGGYLCAGKNDPPVLPGCNCANQGSTSASSNPWGVTGTCS